MKRKIGAVALLAAFLLASAGYLFVAPAGAVEPSESPSASASASVSVSASASPSAPASSSPSASTSASASASGTPTGTTSAVSEAAAGQDTSGSLPLTGAPVPLILAAGLALLCAGIAAVILSRRRNRAVFRS